MTYANRRLQRAFTLLELIVVLAIAATLSSLVLLSLRSHFQQAVVARAMDQATAADRLARRMAQQQSAPGVQLEFDQVNHQLRLTNARDASPSRVWTWPATVQIDAPQVLGARRWEVNQGAINYSADGQCATYYVRLSSGRTVQWLVILGISGQTVVYPTADSLRELLP